MKLLINTDGGSRGNPGPSAYGFIIKTSEGVILHQEGGKIGLSTNNIAEYTAVLKAFEYLTSYQSRKLPAEVEIICDSQLIAQQLSGNFKIKNARLLEIYTKIKDFEKKIGKVGYRNVPRAENFIADRLVNAALDS